MVKIWIIVKVGKFTKCIESSVLKCEEVCFVWVMRFVVGKVRDVRLDWLVGDWVLISMELGNWLRFGVRYLYLNFIFVVYYVLICGKFFNLIFNLCNGDDIINLVVLLWLKINVYKVYGTEFF